MGEQRRADSLGDRGDVEAGVLRDRFAEAVGGDCGGAERDAVGELSAPPDGELCCAADAGCEGLVEQPEDTVRGACAAERLDADRPGPDGGER